MTSNECFLIAHSLPYVEFSQVARTVHVKGFQVAKKDETESIQDDENYAEAYWKRKELEGYKKFLRLL